MSERLIKVEGNKRNSLLSGYMYYGKYVSVHVVCGIHFVSPSLHRGKYLFRHVNLSEGVTHQFYRQLYPNIIRDIDVSLSLNSRFLTPSFSCSCLQAPTVGFIHVVSTCILHVVYEIFGPSNVQCNYYIPCILAHSIPHRPT